VFCSNKGVFGSTFPKGGKIELLIAHVLLCNKQHINMSFSIFIRTLPAECADAALLTYIFQDVYKFGTVKRVDIVHKVVYMAFVHFVQPVPELVNDLRDGNGFVLDGKMIDRETREWVSLRTIVTVYKEHLKTHVDASGLTNSQIVQHYHQNPNEKTLFFRILENKTPVRETKLNIHQIAFNLEMAESRLEDQEKLIDILTQRISGLEDAHRWMMHHMVVPQQVPQVPQVPQVESEV